MASKPMKKDLIELLTKLNKFGMITSIPTDVLSCTVPKIEGVQFAKQQGFLKLPFKVRTPTGDHEYTLYQSGGSHTGDIYRLEHSTGFLFTIYVQRDGIPRDTHMYRAIEDTLHRIEHEYLQEAKLYLKDNV